MHSPILRRQPESRYLEQLDDQQVAFGVNKSVDEAVAATLEMESYLVNSSGGQVGQVASEGGEDPVVAAAQSNQDTMMRMMQKMTECLERLEEKEQRNQLPARRYNTQGLWQARPGPNYSRGRSRQPITCFRYGKEDHMACGCRAPKPNPQETSNPQHFQPGARG